MLTYVINTSENKVLKTDLLFELVGYNKISWMRSPLSAIEDCAGEIVKRQQPMTAGEYRVVVLVDFLAFEKTLFPEENQQNVARFLKSTPDIKSFDFTVGDLRSENGMMTLLPSEHGTDGFFIAKFTKKETEI